MTTITYPDITHKKGVPAKYNPNSYRVISEEVPEHESVPFWYAHARPPTLYTDPTASQLPAQVSEPRNNPHAARQVDVVYSNASGFNAPFGIVKTDNVRNDEARWWDWSHPTGDSYGPKAKSQDDWMKARESSYRNAFSLGGPSGPYSKKNTRYSANPQHTQTLGIVPVTDLKPENTESVDRTLVERVSFEQQYNSRNPANYPLRGRRHGAFVVEEQKPKQDMPEQFSTTSTAKSERVASMWDLFHPTDYVRGQAPGNPYKYRRPLPEIQRSPDYGQTWQSAPYANDFPFAESYKQPSMFN